LSVVWLSATTTAKYLAGRANQVASLQAISAGSIRGGNRYDRLGISNRSDYYHC
jgi:hypothetical protein